MITVTLQLYKIKTPNTTKGRISAPLTHIQLA